MSTKMPLHCVTLSRLNRARNSRLLGFESLEGRRVLAENQAPVNVVPGTQTYTSADPTVVFGSFNRISTADSDVGNQLMRMTLFVNNGTLTLSSTEGLAFLITGNGTRSANGTRYLLFDGTLDAINNALLGMTFRTTSNQASDVLTIDTHDLGHTGTGGAKVDRDTINLLQDESSISGNQPPVNQVPQSQTFSAEQPTVTFGFFNPLQTSDPDAGANLLRVTLFVNSGTLTLATTSGLLFHAGNNNTRYMLFDGTLTDINNALFGLTYTATPGTDFDLLTIDTHDLGHTGVGGAKVDRDSVSLFRTSSFANQAPVNSLPPGQFFTDTNRTVTFDSSRPIFTEDPDAGNLALRMTLFVNGGTLTLGTTNGLTFRGGGNGTRYLLFDGSQVSINNALFNLLYRANPGTSSDLLTIDTHDLGHTGSGGAQVDHDTVTLTRVSGFRAAGNGGSGESESIPPLAVPQEPIEDESSPSDSAASAADSALANPQLLAPPAASDGAFRLASLLASANSGRNKTANSADEIFENL